MRKLWRLLAVLLVFALVAAACGDDDDSNSSGDDTATATVDPGGDGEATETPTDDGEATPPADDGDDGTTPVGDEVCTEDKVGGEVKVTPLGTATTLDQYTNGGSSFITAYEGIPTHSALMYFDSSKREYVPLVAESLTPNDDNSVWTLQLRPEAVFGNGDPLDAAALIAHLDRHLAADSVSRLRTDAATQIASYTALDDYTVEFTLNGPFGSFPGLLTVGLGEVDNVKVIEERGAEAYATDTTGGGVGPYEMVEWLPGERTVYEAKKDWWGGPVCIEKLTIIQIPDMAGAYDAYKTGEIDVMLVARDPVLIKEVTDDGLGGLSSQVNNSAFMVMPNLGAGGYDGPLLDMRVRQAMAFAIDPEVVNARAWGGEGLGTKGIISEASSLLDGTEGIPYDADMAMSLLDEYKAETGWDGSLDAIAGNNPAANAEAAIAIAAMLDAVGFKISLQNDLGVVDLVTKVVFEKDFELVAIWGTIVSETTLPRGFRAWDSTNPANQNGYANPDYDAAVAAAEAADGLEDYQAALDALQIVVNETIPFIPFGADPTTTLYRDTIKGVQWHDAINPFFDQAYIEK